ARGSKSQAQAHGSVAGGDADEATDGSLGDDFKEAAGGDFHKARIIHPGRSGAACCQTSLSVMCASPAASDKLTSASMPMVCAIHMEDSPGLHRGCAVYARCRQAVSMQKRTT